MARIKIDENLPSEAAELLARRGHDAMTVIEQHMGGRDDIAISKVCRSEDRTLVTFDRGFGDPRRHPTGGTPGIIVLRPPSQDAATVLDLLRQFASLLDERSPRSALWIVEPNRVRIRGG